METDYQPSARMDRDARSHRYYRNAVERHWDPGDIDLERDREAFLGSPLATADLEALGFEGGKEAVFDEFRTAIAMFGAGEDAVTEDLAPLAVVLEDIDDQLFLTTQLYEEAKHADFFDRYWREVVWPVEEELGWQRSDPRADKWFNDAYLKLFGRNETAMHRLLENDTPENRAIAYCHYHLAIEGILAQSGYYGLTKIFGNEEFDLVPTLPGLVEGINGIRSDEGRHVGFGMSQLKNLIQSGSIEPAVVTETAEELASLVVTALAPFAETDEDRPLELQNLVDVPGYAAEKHAERMEQVTNATTAIPDVDDLVAIDTGN